MGTGMMGMGHEGHGTELEREAGSAGGLSGMLGPVKTLLSPSLVVWRLLEAGRCYGRYCTAMEAFPSSLLLF